MYPLITTCPVCAGPFHVERMGCANCHAALEAQFTLDWIGRLSREQLDFVRLLVQNRGNINGVAAELKIAYNTARSRLDDIVAALGYTAPAVAERPERPATPGRPAAPERLAILARLDAGEISVEEAMQALRGQTSGQ